MARRHFIHFLGALMVRVARSHSVLLTESIPYRKRSVLLGASFTYNNRSVPLPLAEFIPYL